MSVKDYFNKLFEEPKDEDDEVEEEMIAFQTTKEDTKVEKMENVRSEATGNDTYVRSKGGDAGVSSSVLELKVVRPESYSSVGQIADHLLNRCTVVLNLEATEKDTARRIVDFLNGVAYSIDGQIKPVANHTFIITPKNVAISGEQLNETKGASKVGTPSDEF